MSDLRRLVDEASDADVAAFLALLQIRRRLGSRPGSAVVEIRGGELTVYAVAMSPETANEERRSASRLSF
jgi:hypothetical protein